MKAMIPYCARIAAAWLLLRFASAVMKDAERLLQRTVRSDQLPAEEPATVVEGGETA